MVTRTRILLADDHAVVLDAFRKLLEPHHDMVGTVTDGQALVRAARATMRSTVRDRSFRAPGGRLSRSARAGVQAPEGHRAYSPPR